MRAPTFRGMALTLVNEQADEVVAKLYGDYCRNAAPAAGSKAAPKVDARFAQPTRNPRRHRHEPSHLDRT